MAKGTSRPTEDAAGANYPAPEERSTFLGDAEQLAQLAAMADAGNMTNGWLMIGGEGAGKATLAFELARRLLGAPGNDDPGLGGMTQVSENQTGALIAAGAHPDLFTARRTYDEKTGRYATEISVDTIRKLTQFMTRTPSLGQWRVAIVDTADDLNRNAANALLKVLEEPPARTTLFLLSAAPGRLLATIRSRCRRFTLTPATTTQITEFLKHEADIDENTAMTLAAASRGRPGFALSLASQDGAVAADAAAGFIQRSVANDIERVVQKLTGRGRDAQWAMFQVLITDNLNELLRDRARATNADRSKIQRLMLMRDDVLSLLQRGDGVNLDRGQILFAMARRIKTAMAADVIENNSGTN